MPGKHENKKTCKHTQFKQKPFCSKKPFVQGIGNTEHILSPNSPDCYTGTAELGLDIDSRLGKVYNCAVSVAKLKYGVFL